MILNGVTRTADTVRRQGGRASRHIEKKENRKENRKKKSIIIAYLQFFTSSVTFWVVTY